MTRVRHQAIGSVGIEYEISAIFISRKYQFEHHLPHKWEWMFQYANIGLPNNSAP